MPNRMTTTRRMSERNERQKLPLRTLEAPTGTTKAAR
jgi:hypothetical protein